MSAIHAIVAPDRDAVGSGALSAPDLAELFASFSEATRGLERTHEALRSEVARLQAELRGANEQLQRSRSLAALGEMAAGIAHEVRNPLAAVALRARMLEADLAQQPALRESAVAITTAVRAADNVVSDVLAFARQAPLRLTRAAAHDLLDDAAEAGAFLFAARPWLTLERETPRTSIHVTCDVALIRQALVNVIRNAAEATDERRAAGPHRVHLSAERRDLLDASGARAPMVALIVRDTGPGLPLGAAERMFNPFFTTRDAGAGLGLAIVHRILDAHGGRVRAMNARDLSGASPDAPGAVVELLLPDSPDPGTANHANPGRSATPRLDRPKDAAP